MDFYFIPDTCALAVHIACHEANIPLQLREIERSPTGLRIKSTRAHSSDYMSLNPKQKVPAIGLPNVPNGSILTETQAILQYIAWELAPAAENGSLLPKNGLERWRAVELLNFITTEIHKAFSPLFNPDMSAKHRERAIQDLGRAFTILEDTLGEKDFLIGQEISVIDCYAWTLLSWTRFFDDVDLAEWPSLVRYRQRILQRPSVQKALEEERLVFVF
ncbi:glutathione S-transferase [Trichoderma sp. SZMC 28013]